VKLNIDGGDAARAPPLSRTPRRRKAQRTQTGAYDAAGNL
jgi:hypothetical protein